MRQLTECSYVKLFNESSSKRPAIKSLVNPVRPTAAHCNDAFQKTDALLTVIRKCTKIMNAACGIDV